MTHKFSQEAMTFVANEKSKWAELQLLNAVDQLLSYQKDNEALRIQLDDANKKIDQLVNGEK